MLLRRLIFLGSSIELRKLWASPPCSLLPVHLHQPVCHLNSRLARKLVGMFAQDDQDSNIMPGSV